MSDRAPGLELSAQDFSAGFLDSPEPDTTPPGSSPDAQNCLLISLETQDETRAVLRRRLGSALINPTAIAAGKSIDGIWQYEREGQPYELVVMCNGALYVWDGASTFNAITNGGGFTAGTPATARGFKNNLFVTDGTVQKRYDGTQAWSVGFAAPTSAPGLAVGGGTGLTGTYQGFVVWVDPTTGHLSSPSAISSQVTLSNQQRQWTKPSGSPPSNVTLWRVYCRRVDTNEVNYFQTGVDQAIGTTTYTEATVDAARTVIGPLTDDNDVPPVFALMAEYKQYRLAVLPNSSNLYISALGDAESQNPSNVFVVGGRGDAREVRSIRTFGTNVFLRKPTKAYTLVGDQIPFQITPAGAYGSVHQDAGIEVDGLWYDWDEQRGPYASDMSSTWTPLADARIENIVASVNRLFLNQIRVAHSQAYHLILWAVPTTSSRMRTLLAYNYRLNRWLPPITGFEYTGLTAFTTSQGALGVYFGDQWGRVYQLFSGDVDGAPSGTAQAPITAATSGSITASGATFYTTGSGLAGMPVAVLSPAGQWQWVRVSSNTGTVLTLDTVNGPPLSPVPDSSGNWIVVVGGIQAYWTTPRLTGGTRLIEKRGRFAWLEGASSAAADQIAVQIRYNRSIGFSDGFTVTFPSTGLVWGAGLWGTGVWGGGGTRAMRKHRINRSFFDVQLQWSNFYPGQWFIVTSYGVAADPQPARRVPSV